MACMDARLNVERVMGLADGEAHVIRNAGGVVTDDALRSLVISQRLLGTTRIALVHHTDCGMLTFRDEAFRAQLARETGVEPPFSFLPFADLAQDVREGLARVRACVFLPHRDAVRGYVFDFETQRLDEIV